MDLPKPHLESGLNQRGRAISAAFPGKCSVKTAAFSFHGLLHHHHHHFRRAGAGPKGPRKIRKREKRKRAFGGSAHTKNDHRGGAGAFLLPCFSRASSPWSQEGFPHRDTCCVLHPALSSTHASATPLRPPDGTRHAGMRRYYRAVCPRVIRTPRRHPGRGACRVRKRAAEDCKA